MWVRMSVGVGVSVGVHACVRAHLPAGLVAWDIC